MKCNIQVPCLKPTSFAVDVQLMSKTHGGWEGGEGRGGGCEIETWRRWGDERKWEAG